MTYKIRKIVEIDTENKKAEIRGNKFIFEDGTEVIIYAKVKNPPAQELTPQEYKSIDITTGIVTTNVDNGSIEKWDLADSSQAAEFCSLIIKIAKGILKG